LSFSDDAFATPESVDAMAAFYCNSSTERQHLRPADYGANAFGHFGVFKRSNGRLVWDLIADWALQSTRLFADAELNPHGTLNSNRVSV
jgi:predicted alpha/beta hydrolase